MIPFLEQPSIQLGPITVHAFGAIVAGAVLVGLEFGRRRFRRLGLDSARGERLAWWVVAAGFLAAHVFSVLLYFPDKLVANPLLLLKVWEDISSFGGIMGGMAGLWLFFRLKDPAVDMRTRLSYMDAIAFVFPFALAIGRIACSLAHDHPGEVTSFPLAVSLKSPEAQEFIAGVYRAAGRLDELPPSAEFRDLGFHDLGWYELVYLSLVVLPLLAVLDRKPRPAGFFVVTFIVLYMPLRLGLDFFRVIDVRYVGLTPAQWTASLTLLGLPGVLLYMRAARPGVD